VLPNPFDDQPSQIKTRAAITYGLLAAANIAAWAWALIAFADTPVLLGTAFLAYMFGLRHAFDADHIAAIDNVVRKLMQDHKSPYSAGFFFSLGHSTVVVLASTAIAASAAAMQSRVAAFQNVGGLIGTSVSALFLVGIGIANLFVLKSIWSAFDRARHGGKIIDEDMDTLLAGRGLLARVFRPPFRLVSQSWHMYLIGFLFGLGFDTATEIGMLVISATQAAKGMSFWTILIFPALFTAAMSLLDTTDSVLMTGAYGWAFINPMGKLWYNLTITAASVVVALFIGGVEALTLIGDKLGLEGAFWSIISGLNGNLANLGFVVVGIFIASWIVSVLVYRAKDLDNLQAEES
jgi:high-affinity nickel-transport protein